MSSFAVFLILGGATAFAAVKKIGPNQIKANSIKTGKIVKEAVTAGKIKNLAVIEAKIGDGAVTTNKLADNAVTAPKIANDAVTTEKIAKDAVTEEKLKTDAVTNSKLANNAVNTAELANGAVKTSKLGSVTRRETTETVPNGTSRLATASCNAGERAISGGVLWSGVSNATDVKELHVVHTFPNAAATNWGTRMYNGSGAAKEFTAYVLCLQAG
jgi:hypothetical protein